MSSYNRYFSPAQVESDQKDLIISQIKAEIFELRQNERDYHDLSSNLRNLEHRYNLLSEEKSRNDSDYKNRNDSNLKTIANLKTDVDILKSTLAEKNIEYQENKAENLAIKDIADHRSIDISKLKNELSASIDQNNRLKEEKRNLDGNLAAVRDEKRKHLSQFDTRRSEFEELNYRSKELEKVLRELEYDSARVQKQHAQLQQANESLSAESRAKGDTLRRTEEQIGAADRDIRELEVETTEVEHENEKHRAELVAVQRNHQQEVATNLEATTRINHNENALRSREIQLDDLAKDLDNLNQAYKSQINTNYGMNDELEEVQKQIEKLSLLNDELTHELEAFSQQDEQVRSMLNRKSRVNELKHKSESQLSQSSRLGATAERRSGSPSRSQRTAGYSQSSQRRSPARRF